MGSSTLPMMNKRKEFCENDKIKSQGKGKTKTRTNQKKKGCVRSYKSQ